MNVNPTDAGASQPVPANELQRFCIAHARRQRQRLEQRQEFQPEVPERQLTDHEWVAENRPGQQEVLQPVVPTP